MFALASALLLWIGNPADKGQPENFVSDVGASSILHQYHSDFASLPDEMLHRQDTGTISILFGDMENLEGDGEIMTFFTTDDGEMKEVATINEGDFLAYNGDTVTIEYMQRSNDVQAEFDMPEIYISEISVLQNDDMQQGVTGNTR